MERELDVGERLAAMERSQRRAYLLMPVLALTVLVAAAALHDVRRPAVLRVPELVITDAEGVARVRITGEVPGERRGQGGEGAAGMLLYDATGVERGGYTTLDESGYVGLTLDARVVNPETESTQTAVFRAAPTGETTLRVWNGGDAFEIKVDGEGPRYNVRMDGEVMRQEPEIASPRASSICRDLRDLRAQYEMDVVRGACREHMTGAACDLCFGGS